MPEFNLRQLVRDVLASSTMADPRQLAGEVFGRVPRDEYGAALHQCLPDLVREEIRTSRNRAVEPMAESSAARPARSSKVSGIRDWWQAKLRERVHTGPEASDWLLLGDCGFEQLMFAADERRTIAARSAAKAEEYAQLAEALREAGVERVRDLPEDMLKARLEGEAA